jgi:parallel beta-helix repeat protein
MKKHYLLVLATIILITSTISIANPIKQKETADKSILYTGMTIYVDDNNTQGPWNGSYDYPYRYIHDGILHASDGDTVYVFNGLYNETIILNKSIYFRGQQQDNTIIDGQNDGSVIYVDIDNVRIRGFTIRNSGGYQGNAGITINANNATITESTIYRSRTGISVKNSSETIMTNCRFHTNGYGITFSSSAYATIDQCTFYHNGIGIYFFDTHYITITNSYTDTNGIGFLCEHSSNIQISSSAARDNDDNEGGMFFVDSNYINIINCYIVHNGIGVNFINSSTCFIDHCNFSLNTHFACKLQKTVSSIILTNCIFTKNLRFGLYTQNSAFTVSWNNLYKNQDYGLYAESSVIDAIYNWWGSKNGPAHTGLTKADRGTLAPHEIIYTPWLPFPMPDAGPNWNLNKTFQKPENITPWPEKLSLTGNDSDGDGAPDWWEIKYGYDPHHWDNHAHLDPDGDGLNNLEECYMDQYGASPFHKDVFLELDWTKTKAVNVTNEPQVKEITQMIDAFAKHNITLHVDTGNLGGGEEIPSQAFVSYADLINLYWDYFLHNDLNNPRHRIFHYGLICDYTEGPGFATVCWDNLNSFIIGAQFLAEKYPHYHREWLAITSAMHETGHTFGLIVTKFNGIDNHMTMKPIYKEFWFYITYRSLLNYVYTFAMMDFSDGSHGRGDFNDWGNLDFSFFKNTYFNYPP